MGECQHRENGSWMMRRGSLTCEHCGLLYWDWYNSQPPSQPEAPLNGYDSQAWCECGHEMQLVRPGKYQKVGCCERVAELEAGGLESVLDELGHGVFFGQDTIHGGWYARKLVTGTRAFGAGSTHEAAARDLLTKISR